MNADKGWIFWWEFVNVDLLLESPGWQHVKKWLVETTLFSSFFRLSSRFPFFSDALSSWTLFCACECSCWFFEHHYVDIRWCGSHHISSSGYVIDVVPWRALHIIVKMICWGRKIESVMLVKQSAMLRHHKTCALTAFLKRKHVPWEISKGNEIPPASTVSFWTTLSISVDMKVTKTAVSGDYRSSELNDLYASRWKGIKPRWMKNTNHRSKFQIVMSRICSQLSSGTWKDICSSSQEKRR